MSLIHDINIPLHCDHAQISFPHLRDLISGKLDLLGSSPFIISFPFIKMTLTGIHSQGQKDSVSNNRVLPVSLVRFARFKDWHSRSLKLEAGILSFDRLYQLPFKNCRSD